MKINISNVKHILNEIGVVPSKDYGQNFLIDENIASKIVSLLDIKDDENCLEVGPGLGSLTHFLIESTNKLDVIDIDYNMTTLLNIFYKDKNINIICGDIRKFDISKYDKIISNLPYNITSELILYLIKNGKNVKRMVLMCQKETLKHFIDTNGKEYGPLSVYLHLCGEVKKIFDISNSCFYPIPKCKSSIFTINLYKNINRDENFEVYKFCKIIFKNRRKTIFKNLKSYINDDTIISATLLELNIDRQTRPEQISPHQYLQLFRKIKICLEK